MQPEKLVVEIIKEQSLIIGEQLAKSRAEDTGVLTFNSSGLDNLSLLQGNVPAMIDKLIGSYQEVFGSASVEVCLDVIRKHPLSEISSFLPDSVKSKLIG